MERPSGEHQGNVSSIRRVAIASLVGTALEWYDYFLYGTAAALIFNEIFFPESDPLIGTLLAFATFGVGFGTRPIGGLVFGHYGDKIGRKAMLVITLLIMGIATCAIGLMPTYNQIGIWAPILLVVLRLVQGFGVGGEWGGAVLMAVEHAPEGRRGYYGSWPQMGVPAGLVISTVVFALFELLPEEQFLAWGWRVPFLLSFVLVLVGLYVRLRLAESPAFQEVEETHTEASMPVLEVFRTYPRNILLAMGARLGDNVLFYIFSVFVLTYVVDELGMSESVALIGVSIGAALEFIAIPFFGALSDRIGRRPVYWWRAFLHTLRVPVLLAHEYRGARSDLAGRNTLAPDRTRRHVRAPGQLPLRAVRHTRPLQRRFHRVPDCPDTRWRHRAAHSRRPARQDGKLLAGGRLHDCDGPDNGSLRLPGRGDFLLRDLRRPRPGSGACGGLTFGERRAIRRMDRGYTVRSRAREATSGRRKRWRISS
ncbi:hypothetical protein BH18ACT10_BH18ACT10_18670 [soil metagenome]